MRMPDPFSPPVSTPKKTPQAAQMGKKRNSFFRSWRGKAAMAGAALAVAFSAYSYREHALDRKYEPFEWRIDSAYSANSVPLREGELRGLARLSEKCGLSPGQLSSLTRIRLHLESKRDSVAQYLSKNEIDEERVLVNLKNYKHTLKEGKSIDAMVELLRNSIAGKQRSMENRQRLLCIVYILEGAKNLGEARRQELVAGI